jgi:glutamate racemase
MKGPIAVFDSGYGGLTILESIRQELPQYDYIYLGDNARTPYGTRSFDVVYEYTLEAVKKLFGMGAHLIILACNTASAKALRSIQQKNLPGIDPNRRVLGVIRPSVEVVGNYSETGHIGVLGTVGTVQSESYPLEFEKIDPSLTITQEACPMWVPLVENNEFSQPGADYFVRKHLNNLFEKDPEIDTIVLGCTHYPLLLPKIEQFLPRLANVLSQGDIVSKSLKDYLSRHPEMEAKCTMGGTVKFYTTESASKFRQTAGLFFQGPIEVEHLSL